MKKLIFIVAMISAVMITSCKKTEDFPGIDQQPVQELKHSSTPIPINGSVTGFLSTVPGDCPDGWMGRELKVSGDISHLGSTEVEANYCFKLEYPSPDPGIDGIFNGPSVFTAANGDQIFGYFVGTMTIVWDGSQILAATMVTDGVFTGGTGRFEEVAGFVHCTGYLDYAAGGGIAGTDIPMTGEISGTIQFGAQLVDVQVDNGIQEAEGYCADGSNHYTMTGSGTGTLGNLDVGMDYCATTTFMLLPPPFSITIPIGGTNEGTGTMEDEDGCELNSEYTGLYRFTYEPSLPNTTNLHNDFFEIGTISGGTGDYAGASGRIIAIGTQDIPFSGGTAQFPAPGEVRIMGYFDYPK